MKLPLRSISFKKELGNVIGPVELCGQLVVINV